VNAPPSRIHSSATPPKPAGPTSRPTTRCACGAAAPTPTPRFPPANIQPGDAGKGKAKFEATCSPCHGMDAKGVTGLGKDLTTSKFAKSLPDAQLVTFITRGRDVSDPDNTTGVAMPPRGGNPTLTDQDLADIVAYIRTLQK